VSGPQRTGRRPTGRPASSLSRHSRSTLRLGLRLAARNALRARGRSILIILLVALPVLGLTAAGTVVMSMTGTVAQTVHAKLGSMAAAVTADTGRVLQTASGQETEGYGSASAASPRSWVPESWRVVPLQVDQLFLRTAHGVAAIDGEAGRSWDRGFAGRFQLINGRAPISANELLVTPSALARFGTRIGGTVRAADGSRVYTVVGTMRDLTVTTSTAMVFGQFAAFPGLHITPGDGTTFYLRGPPVTWSEVLAFNRHGGVVESRAVTESIGAPDTNSAWAYIAIFGVIGAFMLIEIALLSGAAFMVGARQQQRALAVLASVGADRRVLRTSVAGGGLVLGAAGAVLGIGLGLLAAWGYMSLTGDGSTTKYYGFDAYPLALVILGIVAVLAAWISAAVPARSASRFDVVAALRGARRPPKPSRLRSAAGIVMIVVGAGVVVLGGALSLLATTQNPPSPWLQGSGPTLLVVGSLVLQLGAILGLPAVLRMTAARLTGVGSGARLASRDLARNSARSVPAIAVVMSTAFVGVFLMVVVSGIDAIEAAQYPWSAPLHAALIQFHTEQDTDQIAGQQAPRPVDASAYVAEVDRVLGVSDARAVNAALDATPIDPKLVKPDSPMIAEPQLNSHAMCVFSEGTPQCAEPQFLSSYGSGAKLIAGSPAELPTLLGQRPTAQALQTLASGGAVSLYPQYLTGRRITIDWWTQKQLDSGANIRPDGKPSRSVTLAGVVDAPAHPGAFGIVISPQTAARIGVEVQPRFILVDSAVSPTQEQQDELDGYINQHSGAGRPTQANLWVETGPSQAAGGIAWIIVAIAALSTLASAVIALSLSRIDGRRDEYTLVAVGAKPRTQRLIAFWQALLIAVFGSLIGGAFALIPSAALAYAGSILFAPPWPALVTSVLGVPVLIAVVALLMRRAPKSVLPDRTQVG
jgi:hypothetical protein